MCITLIKLLEESQNGKRKYLERKHGNSLYIVPGHLLGLACLRTEGQDTAEGAECSRLLWTMAQVFIHGPLSQLVGEV